MKILFLGLLKVVFLSFLVLVPRSKAGYSLSTIKGLKVIVFVYTIGSCAFLLFLFVYLFLLCRVTSCIQGWLQLTCNTIPRAVAWSMQVMMDTHLGVSVYTNFAHTCTCTQAQWYTGFSKETSLQWSSLVGKKGCTNA